MNNPQINELEQRLQRLTEWSGETPMPTLAERAMSVAAQKPMKRHGWLAESRLLVNTLSWVGIAAAVLIVVGMLNPAMNAARVATKGLVSSPVKELPASADTSPPADAETLRSMRSVGYVGDTPASMGDDHVAPNPVMGEDARYLKYSNMGGGRGANGRDAQPSSPAPPTTQRPAMAVDRQVIRKASLELRSKDVRGAVAKAQLLISEARGEYIQESNVSGTLERPEATLTLRVTAERLSSVMNELRELGRAVGERIGGDDVTAQVVDLESRLRNEQRVEAELLHLLETRKDAPLKEVLELRSSIAEVRRNIEQMSSQRETFARLVSLATIVVIIRTEDAPAVEPHEPTLAEYFAASIERAWSGGLRRLGDSVAGIVSVAVSGAVWWVLLIVAGLVVRRWVRK